MRDVVRIGCWAGFWGDTRQAPERLVRGAEIDYLVADHLAEITMALLARARARDPAAGYVGDAVEALAPLLGEIHARSIRVVTNAGGLDPRGCAAALREAAAAAGVPLRVACVTGDDVRALASAEDGEPLTMNAYLGARPIATALGMGADVVVTGRCADSAVVLGPLLHEFGWSEHDHDALSAGSLVGHIVECGPQCLGGLFTDWADVPGWEDMGHPIAECRRDGSAVITKPAGSGGLVIPATVAEQILYEIGDPAAYVLPDVVCDWRDVRLEQDGPDRVRVSGARGSAPTATYKATATRLDGFRLVTSALFAGGDAAGRARRAGDAILARAARIAGTDFAGASVEVVGAREEAVLKIAARHADRAALQVLAEEIAPMGLIAQGMTGLFGGRPRPAPVVALRHVLVDKARVPVTVELDGESVVVPPPAGGAAEPPETALLPEREPPPVDDPVAVPLRRLAYARSGDKGNDANVGVIARRPELAPVIREQLTAARVAAVFERWLAGPVRRYELPGLDAINIVLTDVLGGSGGTSSLRYDPQGKTYAAILLDLPVEVPAAWERGGLLAP
ncbi:MAG TPA: acyclic terpene utilization AtuA family protein [Thermoleophilaceae bacterium]